MKYYVCADIDRDQTTGDGLPVRGRVYCGRVKAIVDAPEGSYAAAIEIGREIISNWLAAGYAAFNFGAMGVDEARELGDEETYKSYEPVN